jgi:glutathione S-transferase
MKLILHSYRRCPFCIRTRILLHLKKIPYEIVEEPLREWTPWMKEWSFVHNERSRVPVLRYVLGDGEKRMLGASQDLEQSLRKVYSVCKTEKVMPESNEMNLFIDTIDENPEFTPSPDTPSYGEMITWWDWCAKELKPMIDLYKYGANLKFDKEAHVFHTIELQKLMQKLEDALIEKPYLLEDRLTLADIAIIPFIRQILRTREGEFDFTPYPHVLAWVNSILETDWFKNEVMKKS